MKNMYVAIKKKCYGFCQSFYARLQINHEIRFPEIKQFGLCELGCQKSHSCQKCPEAARAPSLALALARSDSAKSTPKSARLRRAQEVPAKWVRLENGTTTKRARGGARATTDGEAPGTCTCTFSRQLWSWLRCLKAAASRLALWRATQKWRQALQAELGPVTNICIRLIYCPLKRQRELPGSPVVRTRHFHCQRPGFNPWFGN